MEWHDGLSIVSHSFKFSYHRKFAYQERVPKTFFARARKRFKYPLAISKPAMIKKLETMTYSAHTPMPFH